jgi:hypothetical protein
MNPAFARRIDGNGQRSLVFDTYGKVMARLRAPHVLHHGNEISGTDVAAAETRRAAGKPRHPRESTGILARRSSHRQTPP